MNKVNVYHQINETDTKDNVICIHKNSDDIYLSYTEAHEVIDKITQLLNTYDKQPKAVIITQYYMRHSYLSHNIKIGLVKSIRKLYGYSLEEGIKVYRELFNNDGTIKHKEE